MCDLDGPHTAAEKPANRTIDETLETTLHRSQAHDSRDYPCRIEPALR